MVKTIKSWLKKVTLEKLNQNFFQLHYIDLVRFLILLLCKKEANIIFFLFKSFNFKSINKFYYFQNISLHLKFG